MSATPSARARVISFHYTLKNSEGETLDSSTGEDGEVGEPLSFLEGSGQIIPGLESEIAKMSVGDKGKVAVKAAEGYGDFDETLCFDLPKSQFPNGQEIEEGDQFRAKSPDGGPSPMFTVTKVHESTISVDGNHPLAGQDLFFEVEITAARAATEEELAHGHSHPGDGHHH